MDSRESNISTIENIVNDLHLYIDSIFEYINNPTENTNTNIISVIKSISINKHIPSLFNTHFDEFIQTIINDYLKEIPKTNQSNESNINNRFNDFFKTKKIKIIRKKNNNQSNSTLAQNNHPTLQRSQSTILQRNIIKNNNENKGVYVIQYTDGTKINFAFQEFLSKMDNKDDYYILALINIIRKIYVDILIKIITNKKYYQCEKIGGINSPCSVVAVGSKKLSSNYDVTISGVIYPHKIVLIFNKIFISYWNELSSIVFDTNLYGSTFFITVNKSNINSVILTGYQQTESSQNTTKSILYLPPDKINNTPYPKDSINKRQIGWLIIKIFLHAKIYNIPESITPLFEIINLLKPIILVNNTINNNHFVNFLFKKKFKNKNKETIINNYQSVYVTEYQNSLNDIEKDQLEYHSNLKEVRNETAILEQLNELIESISYSNFYGAETYFCMGTIYHVLGYIQGLANFNLDPIEYYISAIENFIDMYRYYDKMTNDQEYAIIKMSKYALRVYDALTHIDSENQIIQQKKTLFQNILTKFKGQHSFNTSNSTNTTKSNLRTTFPNSTSSSENINFKVLLQNILQTMYNDIQSYQSRFIETIQKKINIT